MSKFGSILRRDLLYLFKIQKLQPTFQNLISSIPTYASTIKRYCPILTFIVIDHQPSHNYACRFNLYDNGN